MPVQLEKISNETGSYLPDPVIIEDAYMLSATEKFYRLRFDPPRSLGHQPGQFVQISVPGVGEAPISICSSPTDENAFELCIRRVGTVTSILHKMEKGDFLGIRGPFGRGFPVDKLKGRDLVMIAGGLGLAPLRSLINYVLDRRGDFGEVTILYGTRSPSDILFTHELISWQQMPGVNFQITVDVAPLNWRGHVGVVTNLLRQLKVHAGKTAAVLVGPPVMYKYVIQELKELRIPDNEIYASLERRMKCGMGKCGHCQINYIYVCLEGPCFCYSDIVDLKEAF